MATGTRLRIARSEHLRRKLRKLPADLRDGIGKGLGEAALKVQTDARRSIQKGSRSGRIYFVTKKRIRHQASAKGEPPKNISGDLIKSIQHQVADDKLSAVVGTNLNYGEYLELGTRHMDERPWLGPAYKKNIKNILRLIRGEVNKAVKRAAAQRGG